MKRLTRTYSAATRDHARTLRQQGFTYTEIIAELGGEIPKNTISGWVSDIPLTSDQQLRIRNIEQEKAAYGRELGTEWNREQKRQRLATAKTWAEPITERLIQQPDALLMMLAALWAGEGSRQDDVLSFSNSDPSIVGAWIFGLRMVFDLDESKFRAQIMISLGMPEEELKQFWSSITNVPLVSPVPKKFNRYTP